MEKKLQNIIMPTSSALELCYELYYRGTRSVLNREKQELSLVNHSVTDFTTYLNGCSYAKWKKYTSVCGAKLRLKLKGSGLVQLVGYHLDVYSPVRIEFDKKEFNFAQVSDLEMEFPDNGETIIGFELFSKEDVVVYGGEYSGLYEKEMVNDVELCLATTTCRKENFIINNVELIKKEILESKDDMKNHFYVHVVDNGRTLNVSEMESWHIHVHPNNNTGGSGGFSRGMIESLEQTPKATHVLLMDDDVVILPESLKRTYRLLTLLDDNYKTSFISGAMLYYEEMNIQHEDIGTLRNNCEFWSLKGRMYQNDLGTNLMNEQLYYGSKRQYAGWWYCCIPTQVIEEKGLSLPIFIRCDDMEYSLRCKADIITMNGIGIWHMGFVNKYNLSFDRYQQCRNLLVDQAVGSIDEDVDVFGFVKKSFRAELLRFNYNGARLVLRALHDYLEGPEFLKEDRGEQIIRENAKLNEKYISLNEIDGVEWDLPAVHFDPPRRFLSTWWYRLTYNGQRLWPSNWLKKDIGIVKFDFTYQPQKYVRYKKILAVNPDLKVAAWRELDKKQYKEIKKMWNVVLHDYKKYHVKVEKEYREQKEYITSIEFWKKYLEI